MAKFARAEVEEQFALLYRTGCVLEDWVAWANMFTEDCNYVERFWGTMHGRDEVLARLRIACPAGCSHLPVARFLGQLTHASGRLNKPVF